MSRSEGFASQDEIKYNQKIVNATKQLPCGKIVDSDYLFKLLKFHVKLCSDCSKVDYDSLSEMKTLFSDIPTNKTFKKAKTLSGGKPNKPRVYFPGLEKI